MTKKGVDNAEKDKSAPILVRFVGSDIVKEDLFIKYLKQLTDGHELTLTSIGMEPSKKRIYLNHHISPELMDIKRKALALKKQKIIQRVTTRYDMIKVQIEKEWLKISTMHQFDTLFPPHHHMETDS